MKIHLIALTSIFAFSNVVLAGFEWTHKGNEGEDASSHWYYFFKSNGDSIEHVRSVWNGGAQNPPDIIDYFIDGSQIKIRHSTGKRDDLEDLIAGRETKLDLVNEYKISSKHAEAMLLAPDPDKPLNSDQRRDLANLLFLLAKDRKPIDQKEP
ncbi:MAG: hypothetical protein R3242_03720 [Akkermansiaceae bacterium]|nr:hypothetical protein [Akkermansiaceae bacterium]